MIIKSIKIDKNVIMALVAPLGTLGIKYLRINAINPPTNSNDQQIVVI